MENLLLLILHDLLPLVYLIIIAVIIYKIVLITKAEGINVKDIIVSFFVIYNRSNINMFGACRRKKFMIANNRANITLYASVILLLFMHFVIRDNISIDNAF